MLSILHKAYLEIEKKDQVQLVKNDLKDCKLCLGKKKPLMKDMKKKKENEKTKSRKKERTERK